MSRTPGWHFLQIPGPTNVPDRVLSAIGRPVIDHRGKEFALLARSVIAGLKDVLRTEQPLALYPASGTGAWEAALVNTLSPGDAVLLCENGYFAALWGNLAERLGFQVERLSADWRQPPDPRSLEATLSDDKGHRLKALLVVHNETSTGVLCNIEDVRAAIDNARHPALLLVDAISSLGSSPYQHDGWGVDVSISASQKGLMLPPGLSLNALSERAISASRKAGYGRGYWDWEPMIAANDTGFFPYTPATSLLYGLREALAMLQEEGLEQVFHRHQRHARATQIAVEHWHLEVFCANPDARSPVLTAALAPEGYDADILRRFALEDLNMSLGAGLGPLAGKVFRVGHLGHFNDLMLCAVLNGIELALGGSGTPHTPGGAAAALNYLATEQAGGPSKAHVQASEVVT
jgi:alanine-glyoxylate transaminase/serine-glyoxylate transaminase/serine-pyruvate transaminase